MGMVDLFKADATVELKVGDLYEFMKVAADNSARAKYLMNAICCEVPYKYAREIITGEPGANNATPQDGTEESTIDIKTVKDCLDGLSSRYKVVKNEIITEENTIKNTHEEQQEAD